MDLDEISKLGSGLQIPSNQALRLSLESFLLSLPLLAGCCPG